MTQQRLQDKPDSARIKTPPKDGKNRSQPKIPRKITATYLHNSGLYYLQRFAASSNQFRRVMQRKIDNSCRTHTEQDPEECKKLLDTLIETFQRTGLLNDEMYATGAIRSLRQRGMSTRAIMAKMTVKGVPSDLIQKTLEEIDSIREIDPNLRGAIKYARRRRIGPYLPPDKVIDEAMTNKHMSGMARAGFDFETARRVLKMNKEDAENLI